ncbi:MAG: hypothetical protein IH595_11370 [Bacteroidales bacterium]|nr:hypothetical protein [Bacteroidales bacterium]
MKDRVANITKWILYAMMFIGALAGVLFYTGGLGSQDGLGTSNFLYLGTFFLYLALIVLIVTPVYTIVKNPQNLKKMLISAGILIVVVVISYGIAGNAFGALYLEKHHTTAEVSRLVGMGLYVVYIMLILSFLTILYSAVIKIFK